MQDFRADQSAQSPPNISFVQGNSDKRKKKKYATAWLVLLCCLISLAGCRHRVRENPQPEPVPPEKYSIEATDREGNRPPQWWLSLNDAELTRYIEEALNGSFTLKQGVARLKQAGLVVKQAGADRYPSVDAGIRGGTDLDDGTLDFSERIGVTFSWEADLWGRLAAATQAAVLDAQAEQEALADSRYGTEY